MHEQSRGGVAAALILLLAVGLAAGNVVFFTLAVKGALSLELVQQALQESPPSAAFLAGAPLLAGIALALWAANAGRGAAVAAPAAEVPAAPPSADAALRLLALLQQEGRLIDFLEEDIAPYDDAQVGAAVRAIHQGCRQVLQERLQLERIIDREDGATVDVPEGFDPAAIRVTGNVAGSPPFRGTLEHAGWRAVKIALPESTTAATIIAPAEVEVS